MAHSMQKRICNVNAPAYCVLLTVGSSTQWKEKICNVNHANNKLSDRFTNLIRHIVYKLHISDRKSECDSKSFRSFIRLLEGQFDRTGGSQCVPITSKNGIVMIKGTKKDLVQEIFKVLANGEHGEHKNDQSDGSCCANPFHYPPPSLGVQLPAASSASSSSVIDVEKVETESSSSDIDVEN